MKIGMGCLARLWISAATIIRRGEEACLPPEHSFKSVSPFSYLTPREIDSRMHSEVEDAQAIDIIFDRFTRRFKEEERSAMIVAIEEGFHGEHGRAHILNGKSAAAS
jgi:hypothetical protein